MSNKLKISIENNTALITINNPPANTWDLESLGFLEETINNLNNNKEVFSLVITGEGEKFFSAGADLKVFHEGKKVAANDMGEAFAKAFSTLSEFRGFSIAAINGFAMGGGLECALACDIRVAENQTKLALPEPKVGLLPCGGGTHQLPRLVGEGWAKRMILGGEQLDANQALKIGLVEEVVGSGESLSRALEFATQSNKQSPISVAACKKLIHSSRTSKESYGYEKEPFVELFDSEDQAEGVAAFLEKRPPEWKNA
jgi:enoyl-CoA hydratase/carnithine racemase|tara:strand:+ start:1513 stop:2283 length:771 start_codon:yes stop_codon:yes gene_type:complete